MNTAILQGPYFNPMIIRGEIEVRKLMKNDHAILKMITGFEGRGQLAAVEKIFICGAKMSILL